MLRARPKRGGFPRVAKRRTRSILACGIATLAFPAGASATVSSLSGTLETGTFSQFNAGAQTADNNAAITIDTSKAYDGTYSAAASYGGGGANNYARAVESINWSDGDSVWFGEAVYLPVGFKNAMQGQVDLFRWDDYPSYSSGVDPCGMLGGLVIWGSDKQARFVNDNYKCPSQPEKVFVGPFSIPEGEWVWFDVHQVLSQSNGSALTQVYMNGNLVGSSTLANKGAYQIARIRYGLVAISANAQTNPLNLWFDRAYIGTSQLGSLGSSSTTPADTTPPTVSVTAPIKGSTVTGSVNLTASASDDTSVANVQWQVDGQNVGSPLTSSPYTLAWNSSSVPDGTHTITAVAADPTGNKGSSSVTLTVSNSTATTTPPSTLFEGESFAFGKFASIYTDSQDSGGKDLKFGSNGTASESITTPAASHLVLRVRAWSCSNNPVLVVGLDGTQLYSSPVSSSSYGNVTVPATITAGPHVLTVGMSNGSYTNSSCGNSIHFDDVTVG